MKLIALDCEFNQPSGKTIQIGAVLFDSHGKFLDSMETNVNPGEPINSMITTLTGITDQDVKFSGSITDAADMLTRFKINNQANPIAIVWGAGLSNDVRHIYEEAGIDSPFKRRIIDVKAIFNVLANSGTQSMRAKVGLGKALEIVGIGWDAQFGEPHRALADAYNTMRMYNFLSHCLRGGYNIVKSMEDM